MNAPKIGEAMPDMQSTPDAEDPPHDSKVKKICYLLGAAIGALGCVLVLLVNWHQVFASGPANTGHEKLACADCHMASSGTVRQQLQAKVGFWLGMRETDIEFGHIKVGNSQCESCHARLQDSHPVHRFLEPRFKEARATLGAHQCVSCHREHTGVRSNLPETSCSACHKDLKLKNEPLDVAHDTLIANNDWASCLGCHDFHNNHRRTVQKRLKQAYPPALIKHYLDGGPSPYGTDMKYPSKGAK